MELFEYAWFGNPEQFNNKIRYLASIAMSENWDYTLNPRGNMPILNNYIKHTFKRLKEEDKIIEFDEYSSFNTGLVTENQEEIFAYFEKNKHGGNLKWYFAGFKKNSEREMCKFTFLPKRAHYFNNPTDLIYDTNIRLAINIDHIIEDNIERFPVEFQTNNMKSQLLSSSVEMTKKRIERNYKTAIPQYFNGKIQLLLPICIISPSKADLALAIEKEVGVYRASTCLTLDMAINNARLIAKPDNEWLNP